MIIENSSQSESECERNIAGNLFHISKLIEHSQIESHYNFWNRLIYRYCAYQILDVLVRKRFIISSEFIGGVHGGY